MTWTVLNFPRHSGVLARTSLPSIHVPRVDASESVLKRYSVGEHIGRFPPRGRSSRDMLLGLIAAITAEKKQFFENSHQEVPTDEQYIIGECLWAEQILLAPRESERCEFHDAAIDLFLAAVQKSDGIAADLAYHLAIMHGSDHKGVVEMVGEVIAYAYIEDGVIDETDIALMCHYLVDPQSPRDGVQAFCESWDEAFKSASEIDKNVIRSPEDAAFEAMMFSLDDENLDATIRAYYQECCAYILMADSAPVEALPYLLDAIRLGRIHARPYLADIYCELKDFPSACEALWEDFWDTASIDSLIRFLDIARQHGLCTPAAEWAHTELEFLHAEQTAQYTRSQATALAAK